MEARRARRRTGRSRGGEARKGVRTERRRARLMWVTRAKRDEVARDEAKYELRIQQSAAELLKVWSQHSS